MYAAFLHVKSTGTASGSIGYVSFERDCSSGFDQAYVGWYTPWSHLRKNYVGGKVAKPKISPGSLYEMTHQTRTKIKTKKVDGISITVYSELRYDSSTSLVYFEIEKANM